VIYVSSDIHGYDFDAFLRLLDSSGFGDEDFLFILGDVIDRGKDGVRYLRWLLTMPNAQLILGNHEAMLLSCDFLFDRVTEESIDALDGYKFEKYLAWHRNGAEPTVAALRKESPEIRAAILEYLGDCPLYEEVEAGGEKFLLVHSGLGNYSEDKPLQDYTPWELLWTRPSPDCEYSPRFTTVFGHTPTGYLSQQHRGRMYRAKTWVDIDTGAASGMAPMLLRLDDMREFYME
jgi:serine/threonine protein phosphatase 1